MRVAHVRICFPDDYSEVPAEDVEDAEMAIESLVSTALVEMFGTVFVDDVTIHDSSEPDDDEYGPHWE